MRSPNIQVVNEYSQDLYVLGTPRFANEFRFCSFKGVSLRFLSFYMFVLTILFVNLTLQISHSRQRAQIAWPCTFILKSSSSINKLINCQYSKPWNWGGALSETPPLSHRAVFIYLPRRALKSAITHHCHSLISWYYILEQDFLCSSVSLFQITENELLPRREGKAGSTSSFTITPLKTDLPPLSPRKSGSDAIHHQRFIPNQNTNPSSSSPKSAPKSGHSPSHPTASSTSP